MSCFILVAGRTGAGKTTFAEAFTGLSVGYEEGSEDDKFGVYAIADNLKFLTVNLFKVFKDENISIYDLDNNNTKENKLEFNTYCIFTEEKQDIRDTIGLVFKDYLESIKVKNK